MKTLSLEELAQRLEECRKTGKRIVHCHGVFDLLHIGHIKHLQAARELGDILVVTVTPDRYVNKGPHRPAFTETLRVEALAALDCVDYVAINEWPTAVQTIELLKPHHFVKGTVPGAGKRDFTDAIKLEEQAVQSVGGSLVLTDEMTSSSSELINRYLDVFSAEAKTYLQEFRQRHGLTAVVSALKDIDNLKVLVIGETILDDYHFCYVMGKASKDPVLAARLLSSEMYAGGALAVANNVSVFCKKVTVLTALGARDSHEEFIRNSLRDNVQLRCVYEQNAPTIIKRRFLEEYSGTKLFEVYDMEPNPLADTESKAFAEAAGEEMQHHDLVLVVDYGHGLLDERCISLLCTEAACLAINVQTNAGNRGYNFISKYPRADFVCIDEPEARLELRNKDKPIEELVRTIHEGLSCRACLITRGKRGCIMYEGGDSIVEVPAFAIKLVDRIGTGDAVLSLASLCFAAKAPTGVTAFLGNVAGAEACGILGNKHSLDATVLCRHIDSLLK